MKKIMITILIAICLFAACSCGNGKTADVTTNEDVTDATAAITTQAETSVNETEAKTETESVTTAKETEAEIRYMDDPIHFRRVAPEYFPKELSFLIPENSDDYIFMRMSDNYCCIGKEIVTVDEAKWFSAQCEAQGMTKQRESLGKSDDGSFDEYSALFDDERFEIHIFTSNVTMDQLEVDITIK